ncbi:MAG: thioredoxin domain-containing protein [Rubricoccaceae bacterium]
MNRLAHASSPYLRQHAHNPVDWWPWSDEAFAEARRRDVPVFLSVGYATCHWCHVMERESFEDAEAAAALNEAFVCVKVDREERPDVDGIYMAACLALNGHGGWPLTALLTPDREPFYVATYLPRETRGGRLGVLDLARRVARFWREDRAGVEASAGRVTEHVRAMLAPPPPTAASSGAAALAAAAEAFARRFDPVHAGFGHAPKFPAPHGLLLLFRETCRTGEPAHAARALATLEAMRRGGLHDHIGGGFHRYATDRAWLLPHFEKMLYDQALLALAYTEGWLVSGEAAFRETAETTLGYVLRDLAAPEGAFYSAEDADSADAHGRTEEGAFYVWTEAELEHVLGPADAALARAAFGTAPEGNYRDEATRERTGANVLHLPRPLADVAAEAGLPEATLRARLEAVRARLFEARAARPRPLRDDKILTDWNGLAIAALARAARAFGRDDYARAAARAAAFLLGTLRTPEGALLHRYHAGPGGRAPDAGIPGFLDDYAGLAFGLTELYFATGEAALLAEARALHEQTRARFLDPDAGGFFVTEADAPGLLVRRKDFDDGALPAGNSLAALNGLRLGHLLGEPAWQDEARRAIAAAPALAEYPAGHAFLLCAAAFDAGPVQEVVLAGEAGRADFEALRAAVEAVYAPHALVLWRTPGEGAAPLEALVPSVAAQTAREGLPTAYVCAGFACQAPATDPDEAAALLARAAACARGPGSSAAAGPRVPAEPRGPVAR